MAQYGLYNALRQIKEQTNELALYELHVRSAHWKELLVLLFLFYGRHQTSYDTKPFQKHTIAYLFRLYSSAVTPKNIGQTQPKNRWRFIA